MEITECPTALERDLNPPNTSRCPLQPHSWWDRPLYFSFSRKCAFFFHLSASPILCTSSPLWITQAAPAGATLSRWIQPLRCDWCCGKELASKGNLARNPAAQIVDEQRENFHGDARELREAIILRETASQAADTHFSLKRNAAGCGGSS